MKTAIILTEKLVSTGFSNLAMTLDQRDGAFTFSASVCNKNDKIQIVLLKN